MAEINDLKTSPWEEEIEITERKFDFPWLKFLIFLFILILLTALIIGYFLYQPQSPQISIEFQKPKEVLAGESFDLGVVVYNNSDKTIKDVNLFILIPEGFVFLENDPNQKMIKVNIGDIAPSAFHKENFKIIAFSDTLTVKKINAEVDYKVEDSKITFQGLASTDLNIGQLSFDVFIVSPDKVFSSENFKMTINYQNRSKENLGDLFLKIDYPATFKFINANPKPTSESNLWLLSNIDVNQKGQIEIIGSLTGQEGQNSNFKINILKNVSGKKYTLVSKDYNIALSKPDLALNILLNNDYDYIASPGEYLNYTFQYKNNLNVPLENVVLKANFIGEMFDFEKAKTDGYFDSLTNTFIWNAASFPPLKYLNPGESGNIFLRINLKDKFPISNGNDKNFVLKVKATIESLTIPPGVTSEKIITFSEIENKVRGQVSVDAFGLYRDASWKILNKGPYPPRVNQLTQYSIHWRIKNYANDISNIKISGFILPGTNYTGIFKSNIDVKPEYNKDSGLFSVSIPFIPANRGVINEPIEIVFQVENTPSINQVGDDIVLLSQTKFEAKNEFTGENINFSLPEIKTNLPNDPTINLINRKVQP
jgi:hypothetical protein